jgi:CubicO group peptidase (beta-lactamase class C family)
LIARCRSGARRLVAATVLLAALSTFAQTQEPASPPAHPPKNETARAVARVLSEWLPPQLELSSVPGAATVVVDRQGIVRQGLYGLTGGPEASAITPDTVFCIRSISKSVTALAVLIAVQDGLLDLDAPMSTYLPEFTIRSRFAPHPEKRITLRHMLSHWAGFAHDPPVGIDVDRPGYFERYVARISDTWLRFPVGYRHQYSNYGFDLVAYLIQVRSGKSFAEYARDKVLRPIGMTLSTFDPDRALLHENRARGHNRRGQPAPERFPEIAAAGLYSSLHDMARYLAFLLDDGIVDGKRLLREDLMEQFLAIQFPDRGQRTGYALGWIREVVSDTYSLYHEGGGRGFGTHLIFYPELGFGVVVLTNREYHGLTGYLGRVVVNGPVINRHGPLPVADPRLESMQPVAVDDFRVRSILGRYGDSPGIALKFENQTLGLRMPDGRLAPVSLYDDGVRLVAIYDATGEARFLEKIGDQPGSMMTLNRTHSNSNFHYLDFNDAPGDPPGPDKPEWTRFVGEYDVMWDGRPDGTATIEIRNGYLYYSDGKCREHEPGLFFRYDGETLDLRSEPATFANLVIRRKNP